MLLMDNDKMEAENRFLKKQIERLVNEANNAIKHDHTYSRRIHGDDSDGGFGSKKKESLDNCAENAIENY